VPQDVHPLLGLLGDGADVQLPLEVLGDGGAQGTKGLHNVNWGVKQSDGAGRAGFFSSISTVLRALSSKLF